MENKILVTRPSIPEMDEYINEIKSIWDCMWITNSGPKHEKFKKELSEYLGVSGIEIFTNGHMALELSFKALGIESGEVITSPFTFVSTTHAIVRSGLTPVFCDIDPIDMTIDPDKIEALITDKTVAIMPIHVYGNICHIEDIQMIADRYGLKVIYDAAHTFGETYKGKGIGTYGDISCFSFHATKVFNSIEGGAACFSDPEIGRKLNYMRDFGIVDEETVAYVGPNAKMNEFSAAMGLCNLRHINEYIAERAKVTKRYREHLEGIKGLRLSPIQKNVKSNHAYFPAIFDEKEFGASRDEVFKALAEHNIGARKYFYPITTAMDCYKGKYDAEKTPVALDISNKILSLPIYAGLSEEEIDIICEIITGCKR